MSASATVWLIDVFLMELYGAEEQTIRFVGSIDCWFQLLLMGFVDYGKQNVTQ